MDGGSNPPRGRVGCREERDRFLAEYGAQLRWGIGCLLPRDAAAVVDREDLVQEVLLRALTNCEALGKDPEHARAWMAKTARNYLIDHLRSRASAERPEETPESGEFVLVGRPATTPGRREEEAEERAAALRTLSALDRELVVSRAMGQSYESLAEELGMEVHALRTRHSRALRRLEEWASRRWDDGR